MYLNTFLKYSYLNILVNNVFQSIRPRPDTHNVQSVNYTTRMTLHNGITLCPCFSRMIGWIHNEQGCLIYSPGSDFTKGLKLSPFFWLSIGLKSKTLVLARKMDFTKVT